MIRTLPYMILHPVKLSSKYTTIPKNTLIKRIDECKFAPIKKNTISLSHRSMRKPCHIVNSVNNTDTWIELSQTIGNMIILYTAIYCSLNWSFYRSIRKQIEKKEKDDKNNEKK
tara:strand:+ start:27 stop:368 length:342 start_codon:yes stop_codon:yes gene_type:complete